MNTSRFSTGSKSPFLSRVSLFQGTVYHSIHRNLTKNSKRKLWGLKLIKESTHFYITDVSKWHTVIHRGSCGPLQGRRQALAGVHLGCEGMETAVTLQSLQSHPQSESDLLRKHRYFFPTLLI